MSMFKKGEWVEVVSDDYLITTEGSIGITVSNPGPRMFRGEMQECVDVLFHYTSYANSRYNGTSFFIRTEDLKVIDEMEAKKKIARGML